MPPVVSLEGDVSVYTTSADLSIPTGCVPFFPVNRGKEKNTKAEEPIELTTKLELPMMLQRSHRTTRTSNMTSDSGFDQPEY
jgi:hypothetical protein